VIFVFPHVEERNEKKRTRQEIDKKWKTLSHLKAGCMPLPYCQTLYFQLYSKVQLPVIGSIVALHGASVY